MNFVEITKDNWEQAIKLKPKRQQYGHLRGDVSLHSLAKCYVFPGKYVPYLIEEGGKPIGCFRFRDYGKGVNLVAFFIDRKYQGRGLGRKAVEHFIEWVRQNYPKARDRDMGRSREHCCSIPL